MHTTRGIKNCRFSRLFKGCSPHQVLNGLIGNHPQTATFHTATVALDPRHPRNIAILSMDLFCAYPSICRIISLNVWRIVGRKRILEVQHFVGGLVVKISASSTLLNLHASIKKALRNE